MKRFLDRYFELLPIAAIILIMMAAESRHLKSLTHPQGLNIPTIDTKVPRLIFR
jgi:hypothetical protein